MQLDGAPKIIAIPPKGQSPQSWPLQGTSWVTPFLSALSLFLLSLTSGHQHLVKDKESVSSSVPFKRLESAGARHELSRGDRAKCAQMTHVWPLWFLYPAQVGVPRKDPCDHLPQSLLSTLGC